MNGCSLRLHESEYEKIMTILCSLQQKFDATAVILATRSGQEVAWRGREGNLERQALASLAAGSLAATFGLAQLSGEAEFQHILHKGKFNSILIIPAGQHALFLFLIENTAHINGNLKTLRGASLVVDDILAKCEEREGKDLKQWL